MSSENDFQEIRGACLACGAKGALVYHLSLSHPTRPRDRDVKCSKCGVGATIECENTAPRRFTVTIWMPDLPKDGDLT